MILIVSTSLGTFREGYAETQICSKLIIERILLMDGKNVQHPWKKKGGGADSNLSNVLPTAKHANVTRVKLTQVVFP